MKNTCVNVYEKNQKWKKITANNKANDEIAWQLPDIDEDRTFYDC